MSEQLQLDGLGRTCKDCGKAPVAPGKWSGGRCRPCQNARKVQQVHARAEREGRQMGWGKQGRPRKSDVCTVCGAPRLPRNALCEEHLREYRAAQRERYRELYGKSYPPRKEKWGCCSDCQQESDLVPGRRQCRECWRKRSRSARSERDARLDGEQPNGARRYWTDKRLLYAFGLSFEQRAAKLTSQGGRCRICGRALTDWQSPSSGDPAAPQIDHDHTLSGAASTRDILCGPCNRMVSCEDPDVLEAGAAYLRRWHAIQRTGS